MSRRAEVCREFLRGNCRFGSRCKFFHDFAQQQRQQPGFAVKNQGQHQPPIFSKGGNYYSPLTSQRKEKTQSQTPIKEHRCTELKDCKLQIKEDLENEQPVFWSLTCYAHGKYLVNDVDGDVSFEELRAHAYAAGKQGVSFDSVVQSERSMFTEKKKEFDYLLRSPYTGPASGRGFHGNNKPHEEASKMSFGTATPGFSSPPFGLSGSAGPSHNSAQSRGLFGSVGSKNVGGFSFGLNSPSGPAVSTPVAVSAFSQSPPAPGFSFGMRPSEPKPFAQGSSSPSPFESSSLPFSAFGQGSSPFGPSFRQQSDAAHGLFVASIPTQNIGSSIPPQNILENKLSNAALNEQAFEMSTVLDTSMNQSMTEATGENAPVGLLLPKPTGPSNDRADIWLKETWTLGEIPEEEPPRYAR